MTARAARSGSSTAAARSAAPTATAGAANAGLFGASLWNLPVVLSTHVGAGTALVGNFGLGAHLWRRGGVSVEASNSHSNYFQLNLVALRAEERLALGLYRPAAFTEVRGLD